MAGKVSSDPNVYLLPDIGEGLTEAELIRWLVKPGDTVEPTDALAEVETDKALTEVTSPRGGVIKTLHGNDGDTMLVGEPFVTFEGDGSGAASSPAPNGSASAASSNGTTASAAAEEDAGTVVGAMSAETPGMTRTAGKALATPAVRRVARDLGVDIDAVPGSGIGGRVTKKDIEAFHASGGTTGAAAPAAGQASAGPSPAMAPASTHSPVPATTTRPLPQTYQQPHQPAHQQAYQQGMQPTPHQQHAQQPGMTGMPAAYGQQIPMGYMPVLMPIPYFGGMPAQGSGLPAMPGYTPPSGPRPIPAPAQQATPDGRVPFRGVRRTIAQRLRDSVNTAVHFTVMDECDVTALDAYRRDLAAQTGTKLSFLPFVAAAVCRSLGARLGGRFGALNATVDEQAQEITQHAAVHLGIAADTDSGLMVPVIRDADQMDAVGLGGQIASVAKAARDRSIPRDQLMGSTFTISNVGSHAGRFATPVINSPEVGILAVGKVYDGVVVHAGQAAVGKVMPLSLACDHRVVDGATAALCLAEIAELLSDPGKLG